MSVHAFLQPAPPDPAPPESATAPTRNIWQVARRLGVPGFGEDRLARYLAQLIADHGFPRPLPAPCKRRVVAAVHANSQWVALAVDHWFDGFLPPDCHAALDARALDAAASQMDDAAQQLSRSSRAQSRDAAR